MDHLIPYYYYNFHYYDFRGAFNRVVEEVYYNVIDFIAFKVALLNEDCSYFKGWGVSFDSYQIIISSFIKPFDHLISSIFFLADFPFFLGLLGGSELLGFDGLLLLLLLFGLLLLLLF